MKRIKQNVSVADEELSRLLTQAYDSRLDGFDAAGTDPVSVRVQEQRELPVPDIGLAELPRREADTGAEGFEAPRVPSGQEQSTPRAEDVPAALRPVPRSAWAPLAPEPAGETGAESAPAPAPVPAASAASEPSPSALRAQTSRQRFLLRAAAVAAVLALLVGGVLLLKDGALRGLTEPTAPNALAAPQGQTKDDPSDAESWFPIPENVYAGVNGDEAFWVMEGEYEGEFDLQHPDERIMDERVRSMTKEAKAVSSGYPQTPPGFAFQKMMSYDGYKTYCESWGLEQKYDDPDRSYLVCSWAQFQPAQDVPRLADVVRYNDAVWVYLWQHRMLQDYSAAVLYGTQKPVYWVLTVPMDKAAAGSVVSLVPVVTMSEYARYWDANLAKLEQTEDGIYRIQGRHSGHLFADDPTYQPYESRLPFAPIIFMRTPTGEIGLIVDTNTELINEEILPDAGDTDRLVAALIRDNSSALRLYAEDCTVTYFRSATYPMLNDQISAFYHVGRLTVLGEDEDPMGAEALSFTPLSSYEEILDRILHGENYESELRTQSMVGGTQNCVVFDYDGGSLCAIYDINDPENICGAWLFDAGRCLRLTVRGTAVYMPDPEAFSALSYVHPSHQNLIGLTLSELLSRYGSPLYSDTIEFSSLLGSGAARDAVAGGIVRCTWFTVEGELVTVFLAGSDDAASGEDGAAAGSDDAASGEDDPTVYLVSTYNPFTGVTTPSKDSLVIITDPGFVITVPTDPADPTETPEPTAVAPAMP